MLPIIVKHVLNNDGLRILGIKRPVADAKWEEHLLDARDRSRC